MKRNIIIGILFLLSSFSLFSQEIEANVIVNMEQLEFEARNNVANFDKDIMNYINNQSFTGEKWEGPKIPVEINIYLSGGRNGKYSARMFIVSKRTLDGPDENTGQSVALRMIEDNWAFEYGLGAFLSFNMLRYDRISSMIDYYMFLVIGMDKDTYGELDGSKEYEKAKSIFQLGASNNIPGFKTFSNPGEFTKYNLITELTDMRYEEFRKLIFAYYVDGLDRMAFNKETATEALAEIISDMAAFKQNKLSGPSVLLQLFFDTKAQELASIFRGYKDKKVFNDLIYLDPSNTMLYNEAKDSR
ncbi:MAG: DUF4835 family protein [Candidatus Kapabacteria bacterium]|nr:DUF4835 family protein [Candidatus Kapabacteria bacterium]